MWKERDDLHRLPLVSTVVVCPTLTPLLVARGHHWHFFQGPVCLITVVCPMGRV